jgi:predicted AlkP superfamily phosphohydrolase/phosphomutase
MDPTHPRHVPNTPTEFRKLIRRTYEQLDGAIGRLLERLPADVRVFIVSDHGFCSELFEVRVNEALARAGLLSFKHPATRRARAAVKALGEKVSRRLKPASTDKGVLERKVQVGGFLDEIDWNRTRAFFAQDKGVWVNLAGREKAGVVEREDFDTVVEEARKALLELECPDDGQPLFERVLRRDEAFTGRWSQRLPDLVMTPRRDHYVYNERPGYGKVIVPADSTTGTHSRDGIFIAWGKGITCGVGLDAQPNLRDVAPTALASLGCPLTTDMDGRALGEIFSQGAQSPRQGSSYRGEQSGNAGQVFTEDEESEVTKRLQALGYIE